MSAFDFGRMNWSLAGDDGSFSESSLLRLGGHFSACNVASTTRASFTHFPDSRNDKLWNTHMAFAACTNGRRASAKRMSARPTPRNISGSH